MDIQRVTSSIESSQGLKDAAGRAGLDPGQAGAILQGVIDHAAAGDGVEGMVSGIAEKVGIDPAQVQQFLPSVMGLLRQHSETAPAGAQEGLSGILSGLQSSPIAGLLSGFDRNKDGSVVDDAIGMVAGLFGKKPS